MRTRRKNISLILALGMLNALTPFSIDLYLPAFPQIAADLGVAVARMSLTVSLYFIGFALGQIFYGPLLDRFGRKPPLYVGIALYIVSSLGCMSAQSFGALLFFRFLSALGGSAASVGSTSMVRDYFPAEDAGKIFSMLMLVLSASPLLAPSCGSLIVGVWGWRFLFGALIALAVFDLLLVVWVLPASYAPDPSVSLRLEKIAKTFREIFLNPKFRCFTLSGSLSFGGLFVFVAGSPAMFMEGYGVSAGRFGMIFAILAGGMIGGGQLNHVLLKTIDAHRLFRLTVLLQGAVGAVFLAGALTVGYSLWFAVGILFLFLLCSGIAYPNATALALEPFSKNIGSASALLGFLQLGLGSLAAALVGLLNAKGAVPMAWVMFLCSAGGWLVIRLSQVE